MKTKHMRLRKRIKELERYVDAINKANQIGHASMQRRLFELEKRIGALAAEGIRQATELRRLTDLRDGSWLPYQVDTFVVTPEMRDAADAIFRATARAAGQDGQDAPEAPLSRDPLERPPLRRSGDRAGRTGDDEASGGGLPERGLPVP